MSDLGRLIGLDAFATFLLTITAVLVATVSPKRKFVDSNVRAL